MARLPGRLQLKVPDRAPAASPRPPAPGRTVEASIICHLHAQRPRYAVCVQIPMRTIQTFLAMLSLSGVALCVASCATPATEPRSETEDTAQTSEPEPDHATPDDEEPKSDSETAESSGALKVIRCKKSERGEECMERCAEQGVPCAAGRRHPYMRNVGLGLLGQCRSAVRVNCCWYYYKNGHVCRFIGNLHLCLYQGGRHD